MKRSKKFRSWSGARIFWPAPIMDDEPTQVNHETELSKLHAVRGNRCHQNRNEPSRSPKLRQNSSLGKSDRRKENRDRANPTPAHSMRPLWRFKPRKQLAAWIKLFRSLSERLKACRTA